MEQPKRQISAFNVIAIRVQRHANVSKQATLLDGLNVSPLKRRVCECGLNRFVHEVMNHISNVDVHLTTRSGNVHIKIYSRHILLSKTHKFTIRESPPQFENRIMAQMYVRSITRRTTCTCMYQKAPFC